MKIKDKIIYYWLCSVGYTLGVLPLRLQYIISDILCFIIYNLFRYRINVVRINLKRCFPDKTTQELREIERKFYKHLVDAMMESIAIFGTSAKKIKKRLSYKNSDEFNEINANKSVIAAMSHLGSWEYTVNYAMHTSHSVLAVYHPLTSKGVDKFYYKMRSKFGVEPTPMHSIGRQVATRNKDNISIALIADQSPPVNKEDYWIKFLNNDTLFFRGMETIAERFNMPIMYLNIKKVKRGYYQGEFILIYDGDEKLEPYEITKRYAKVLEENIMEQPHLWLWTHKRWKKHPNGKLIY